MSDNSPERATERSAVTALSDVDLTRNIATMVADAATAGNRTALVDAVSGRSLTWADVNAAVTRAARQLIDAGVSPGDRVMVRLPVGIDYCVAVFAVLRAGAIVVPLHTDLPPAAVAELVADCSPVLLLGDEVPGTETPTRPFTVASNTASETDPEIASATTDSDESGEAGGPRESDISKEKADTGCIGGGEDIAVLCYTSGTSGRPRGVLLSHRALLANVAQCAALRPAPVTANDRVLLSLPLSHAYGLGPGLLQVAAAGATGVLLPRFGVREALDAIRTHRVTALVGVPPMYAALLTVPEPELHDALSTIRLFTSGAAPLPVEVLAAIRQVTGLSVYEGYGLTETAPVLTSTLASGHVKPGSVGRPLVGVELRIVDSDGDPLPGVDDEDDIGDDTDGAGVVAVRGPNLFSGYWPDGGHGADVDGWFRTGDIGYVDEDGDLHLVDRANDLIIVNGFNVYPHEVEQVLVELDGVREAAAVGVADERTGETVHAFVILEPGVELSTDAVVEYCGRRLARFKVPSLVKFVDELPHSPTGKLARRSLRL